MKAVVKVRPEPGVEVLDVPAPEAGRGEALIRVRAAAICGSDLGIYDYTLAYSRMRLPVVLGHEFAGEVVDVGPGVGGFGVGDRVLFARYAGTEVKVSDQKLLILRESDILAIIQD